MTDNNSAANKSIVNELNFGAKTAKRVGWEQFEFTIEAPHLVRVTNASYGFEKDDHSYLVGVEDRDGLLIPSDSLSHGFKISRDMIKKETKWIIRVQNRYISNHIGAEYGVILYPSDTV